MPLPSARTLFLILPLLLLGAAACAPSTAPSVPSSGTLPAGETAGVDETAEAAASRVADSSFWHLAEGPYGGQVYSLARDGRGRLFAGTGEGLFRRAPEESGWTRLEGPAVTDTYTEALDMVRVAGTVQQVAVPSDSLLVARFSTGLVRSRDGGQTWTHLDRKLLDALGGSMGGVTTFEAVGETLYAATEGLMRSPDAGETWQHVLGDSVRVEALLTTEEGEIFATGTSREAGSRVFRSADGLDWTEQPAPPARLLHLAEAPDGALLGLGLLRTDSGLRMELYRSADAGVTWSQEALPTTFANALATGPDGQVHLLTSDALYRRRADGSWMPLLTGVQDVRSMSGQGGTLYAGTGAGIMRSTDGGQRWIPFNQGLRGVQMEHFTGGPTGPQYALGGGLLFQSTDDGRFWQPVPDVPDRFYDVAAAPNGTIFAVTRGNAFYQRAGDAWALIDSLDFRARGLDVTAGGTPLVQAREQLFRLVEGELQAVESLPEENTYERLWSGPGGLVFADGIGPGVLRSQDGGRSFEEIADPALVDSSRDLTLYDVAFGPDGAVYAARTKGGVVRSTDQGASWAPLSLQGLEYRTDPRRAPNTRNVLTLVVAPRGELFAGTMKGGVYQWKASAEAWQPVLEGLTTGSVEALHITPAGHVLAATPHGVFRSVQPSEAGAHSSERRPSERR